MKKLLRIFKITVSLILGILALVILYLRISRFSDRMIYQTNGSAYAEFVSDLNHESLIFKVEEDVVLHGVLFKPDSVNPIGTIIHFSGKGMHLMSSVQDSYKLLTSAGFQIFCFERRDFGMSNGNAKNSQTLKEDALQVYDKVIKRDDLSGKPIIIWGQSLGGAFATMLASERQNDIAGLILEGTFSSFPDIGKVYASALNLERFKWVIPLIMRNDFPAKKNIKVLTIPTTIIHSKNDDQVPFYLGEKLFEHANKKNTKFWVIDSKHIMGIYDNKKEYVSHFNHIVDRNKQ